MKVPRFRSRGEQPADGEQPDPQAPTKPGAEQSEKAPGKPDDEPKAQPAATPAPRQSADPHERIDGLRAWIGQLDRKLGVRSYAGGAALVLALAAGIVGIVLALSAKDESATKEDLGELREQVSAVQEEASTVAEEQVATLSDRVEALEEQISDANGDQTTLERELEVVQDDIDDLRSQLSDLEQSGGGGQGGGP